MARKKEDAKSVLSSSVRQRRWLLLVSVCAITLVGSLLLAWTKSPGGLGLTWQQHSGSATAPLTHSASLAHKSSPLARGSESSVTVSSDRHGAIDASVSSVNAHSSQSHSSALPNILAASAAPSSSPASASPDVELVGAAFAAAGIQPPTEAAATPVGAGSSANGVKSSGGTGHGISRSVLDRAEGRIPMRVVEDHHHALNAWLESVFVGRLPARGVSLLHIDSHSDMVFPEGPIPPHARHAWATEEKAAIAERGQAWTELKESMNADRGTSSNALRKRMPLVSRAMEYARHFQRGSQIDSFIWMAAALGLLDHIIYIHPDVSSPNFTFDLGVSGEFGTRKMTIAWDASSNLCVLDAIGMAGNKKQRSRRRKGAGAAADSTAADASTTPDAPHGHSAKYPKVPTSRDGRLSLLETRAPGSAMGEMDEEEEERRLRHHEALHMLPLCNGPTLLPFDVLVTVAPLSWLLDGTLTTHGYMQHQLSVGMPLGRNWWEGPLILDIDLDYFAVTDSAFSKHRGDYTQENHDGVKRALGQLFKDVCVTSKAQTGAVIDISVLYLSGILSLADYHSSLRLFGCGVATATFSPRNRLPLFMKHHHFNADPGGSPRGLTAERLRRKLDLEEEDEEEAGRQMEALAGGTSKKEGVLKFKPAPLSGERAVRGANWDATIKPALDALDAKISSLTPHARWVLAHMLKECDPPLLGAYQGNPEMIPTPQALQQTFIQLQQVLNATSFEKRCEEGIQDACKERERRLQAQSAGAAMDNSPATSNPTSSSDNPFHDGPLPVHQLPLMNPSVVTISRSGDDGFLPSDLWPTVERGLLKVLDQAFPNAQLQYAPGLGPLPPDFVRR